MQDWIGWVASAILVLTLGRQVFKQWHDETSKGVSVWLYVGQIASSIGFIVYSWQVKNWVFVVTNSLLFINNIVGFLITRKHKRRAAAKVDN